MTVCWLEWIVNSIHVKMNDYFLAIITGQLVPVSGNVQWCYKTVGAGTLSQQSQVFTTTTTSKSDVSSQSIFIKRHCLRPPVCVYGSGTIEFWREVFSIKVRMATSSDEHNLTSLHDLHRATAIKFETTDSFTPVKRDNWASRTAFSSLNALAMVYERSIPWRAMLCRMLFTVFLKWLLRGWARSLEDTYNGSYAQPVHPMTLLVMLNQTMRPIRLPGLKGKFLYSAGSNLKDGSKSSRKHPAEWTAPM